MTPATAGTLRLGQTLAARWTLTSPAGQDVSATLPITARFSQLGRPGTVSRDFGMRIPPADRAFVRAAEDSRNQLGSAGITSCSPCSGGTRVGNLGGGPDAAIRFENVTAPGVSAHRLLLDHTANGDRSFLVSGQRRYAGRGEGERRWQQHPTNHLDPGYLAARCHTIKVANDADSAPDLDRLSVG